MSKTLVSELKPFVEFNLPYTFANSSTIEKKVDINDIIMVYISLLDF